MPRAVAEPSRRAARPAAALALALAPACAGGGADPAEVAAELPPSLLLVVVDTLRADHVGANGHALPTTPTIDALAREGALFTQAIAHAPWTRPSMAALVTGLLPAATGLTCHEFRVPRAECDVLSPALTTLAERLRDEHGYATAGVVANLNVDAVFGFDQGYERYVSVPELLAGGDGKDAAWRHRDGWLRASTTRVTDEALAWLAERPRDRPFLLYLHYLDPHAPYEPPPSTAGAFGPEAYPGADAETAALLARYDAEVLHVDRELARVLSALEADGARGRTAVVVTSDHGEEFRDHGGLEHGWTVFDEQLRVPLVVAIPGVTAPGTVVRAQVRLVDVVPTLLVGLGLCETPPAELHGSSLLPLLAGDAPPPGPALSAHGYVPVASWRAPPWKLVAPADGPPALYRLDVDPGETTDVAAAHPDVAARLAAELEAMRRRAEREAARYRAAPGPVELSPAQARGLSALGYVGDG